MSESTDRPALRRRPVALAAGAGAAVTAVIVIAVLAGSQPPPEPGPDQRFLQSAGLPAASERGAVDAARRWCADVSTDNHVAGHDDDLLTAGLTTDELPQVKRAAATVYCPVVLSLMT